MKYRKRWFQLIHLGARGLECERVRVAARLWHHDDVVAFVRKLATARVNQSDAAIVTAVDDDVLGGAGMDEEVELLVEVEHVGDRRQRRLGPRRVRPTLDDRALLGQLQPRLRSLVGIWLQRLDCVGDRGAILAPGDLGIRGPAQLPA